MHNHHKSTSRTAFLVLAAYLLTPVLVYAQSYTKQLADGVTLHQQVMGQNDSAKPQVINIVTVDPKKPGVCIKAVVCQERVLASDITKGRETISSIAKRLNAAAVVNADFFPFTGDMLNMHITGGEIVSEPMPNRMIFGLTADGRCLFDTLGFDASVTLTDGRSIVVRGINRPRGKNEVIAFTPKFSPSTMTTEPGAEVVVKVDGPLRAGTPISGVVSEINAPATNTAIPEGSIVLSGGGTSAIPLQNWLDPGDHVTIEFKLIPSRTSGWDDVTEAVGGGPWLIRKGVVSIDYDEEGFGSAFADTLNPRTAVGVTADGKIILATVDGRQSISIGIQLKQLAALLISQGCVEAANLDGGGSTTLATASGVLNSPSEGIERPVANALAVTGNAVAYGVPALEFAISPASGPVKSGTCRRFSVTEASGNPLDQALQDQVIWSTTGGAGFVDQSGRFYGVKARKGAVIARLGSVTASTPVDVIPGAPSKFTARLDADQGGAPNRGMVTITLTDANLNAVDGSTVNLTVTGGAPDMGAVILDRKSNAQVGITWDDTPGVKACVEVSLAGFPSQTLNRSAK